MSLSSLIEPVLKPLYVRARLAEERLRSGIAWWPLAPGYLAECGHRFRLLGTVSPEERAAWNVVELRRRMTAGEVAATLGRRGDQALRELVRRRLVYLDASGATTALSALIRNRAPDVPRTA